MCIFCLLSFAFVLSRISDSKWMLRGFMLCLCLFSERWRERRTPPICGSSEKRKHAIGELLLLQQLVSTLWEGEGRGGRFKSSIPHSEIFTLEEESDQGGFGRRGNKGPPPQPPVFTNNRRQFPSTEPSWHSLWENLTSTSTNKCQEKQLTRQHIRITRKWRRTVGQTRREKQQPRADRRRCLLNAYPLCPGNNETRDQRRRRISVKISEGKRTRKRPTGPNVQPKLTGHLGR